jgi:mono/diheme cytochrome c family protein
MMERGQDRYEVFCQMCHGLSGDGLGIIMTGGYGYTPAPTFHDDRLRNETDGYLYEVITNGVRNMPGYGYQIPVADRWAIVAYVRALQLSQDATLDAVPEDQRGQLPVAEMPVQEEPATTEEPDPAVDEDQPAEDEEL